KFEEYKSFVVADIPGLIEGAHRGVGLGFQFLRHVERTSILLHLVDISDNEEGDPVQILQKIDRELELYSPVLIEKPVVVVGTKFDAAVGKERLSKLSRHCKREGIDFFPISAVTGQGVSKLLSFVAKKVEERKEASLG
ncbi:MAG: GTPase, partial [Acidobacteriota bacterium]